jgi:hypothetical protein
VKIWEQLGFTSGLSAYRAETPEWGQLPFGQALGKLSAVFPRIDIAPAVEKLVELELKEKARQDALVGKAPAVETAAPAASAHIAMMTS